MGRSSSSASLQQLFWQSPTAPLAVSSSSSASLQQLLWQSPTAPLAVAGRSPPAPFPALRRRDSAVDCSAPFTLALQLDSYKYATHYTVQICSILHRVLTILCTILSDVCDSVKGSCKPTTRRKPLSGAGSWLA